MSRAEDRVSTWRDMTWSELFCNVTALCSAFVWLAYPPCTMRLGQSVGPTDYVNNVTNNTSSNYVISNKPMDQSRSWEAHTRSASQIPRLLWDPKVHYHVHKSPSLIPVLIQINGVPIYTPSFFVIHFNIILPPTSTSPLMQQQQPCTQ
jgi:hypothetical protein